MVHPTSPGVRAQHLFMALALVAVLLLTVGAGLIAFDQQQVLSRTQRMQVQTLPQMISHQRLARNLERLHQEGENIFAAQGAAARQQALFMARLIAAHPGILEDPRARALADQVQRLLQDTVDRAPNDPAALARNREAWRLQSRQLGLLIDEVFSESVGIASSDLNQVADAIRSARYKLYLVLPVFIVSLLLLIWLVNRLLIKPLQQIDRNLLHLQASAVAPTATPSPLREIAAVQAAIGELHHLLRQQEQARASFEALASLDGLTGLMNRRKFIEMAQAELKRDHRHGRPVVVAMADIDFFKKVNDAHGHAAGDQVLTGFARLLKQDLRQTDLVGRIGGEEFAFVLPELTVEQAETLMQRIRRDFSQQTLDLGAGAGIRSTVSIGMVDASDLSLDLALQRADEALYTAKSQGRNRVEAWQLPR